MSRARPTARGALPDGTDRAAGPEHAHRPAPRRAAPGHAARRRADARWVARPGAPGRAAELADRIGGRRRPRHHAAPPSWLPAGRHGRGGRHPGERGDGRLVTDLDRTVERDTARCPSRASTARASTVVPVSGSSSRRPGLGGRRRRGPPVGRGDQGPAATAARPRARAWSSTPRATSSPTTTWSSGAADGGITVTLSDGRVYDATVVGTDPTTDLAVLALTNPPNDLMPADARRLLQGQGRRAGDGGRQPAGPVEHRDHRHRLRARPSGDDLRRRQRAW